MTTEQRLRAALEFIARTATEAKIAQCAKDCLDCIPVSVALIPVIRRTPATEATKETIHSWIRENGQRLIDDAQATAVVASATDYADLAKRMEDEAECASDFDHIAGGELLRQAAQAIRTLSERALPVLPDGWTIFRLGQGYLPPDSRWSCGLMKRDWRDPRSTPRSQIAKSIHVASEGDTPRAAVLGAIAKLPKDAP